MDIGDCSPVFVFSPTMASGGGSVGGGGTGGLESGVLGSCDASPLFLSSSFVSFETELLIELELLSELFSELLNEVSNELLSEVSNKLLSGGAVSTVGVGDSSETPTINCVVEDGTLIEKKRPGSISSSFRTSDHIEWR